MCNMHVRERGHLQLRAEAINGLNHPNFGGLATTFASTNFGQLTSAGDPRALQLVAKIVC